jgi:hypothetical protein
VVAGPRDDRPLLYYEAGPSDGSAATYGEALMLANRLLFEGPAVDIIAVVVGGDVVVFVDVDGDDNGGFYVGDPERSRTDEAADLAIVLVGRNLADISASSFGAGDADPNTGIGTWDY